MSPGLFAAEARQHGCVCVCVHALCVLCSSAHRRCGQRALLPARAVLQPTLALSKGQGAGPRAQGRGCGGRSLLPELLGLQGTSSRGRGSSGLCPLSSHRNAVALVASALPSLTSSQVVLSPFPRGLTVSLEGKLPFSLPTLSLRMPEVCIFLPHCGWQGFGGCCPQHRVLGTL